MQVGEWLIEESSNYVNQCKSLGQDGLVLF